MKQQEKEQADVVFGIKLRAFLEKQLHPMRGIGAFVHWGTFTLLSAHQKHLITSLLQSQTRLVDPLVSDQVIDNRYDDAFHRANILVFFILRQYTTLVFNVLVFPTASVTTTFTLFSPFLIFSSNS